MLAKRTVATSKRPSRKAQATAHHEAGHAVVWVMLGGKVKSLTLEPPMVKATSGLSVADEVAVCWAGAAAEAMYTGKWPTRGKSTSGDLICSVELLRAAGYQNEEAIGQQIERGKARALELTERAWAAVERVAEAALQKPSRKLTGREIQRLVFGQPSSQPMWSAGVK